MATRMYLIETLSNMHVGSGNVNYGVVDNLIQRDVACNLPNINASSLKGAIREFFKEEIWVKDIFGSDPKDPKKTQQGNARFFEANLLSIPIRSNKKPYFMVTSKNIITEISRRMELFCVECHQGFSSNLKAFLSLLGEEKVVMFEDSFHTIVLEDISLNPKYIVLDNTIKEFITNLFGENLIVVDDNTLSLLCDDNHLPVLARNNLENGESTNLWYEQVLPRFTRFYFMFMEGRSEMKNLDNFYIKLESNLIQIGANASIGYGFCRIADVNPKKDI